MGFYTIVLKKSGNYHVALCLENGLSGQGKNKEDAIGKLMEAVDSFNDIYQSEDNVHCAPLSIKELHEFLTVEVIECENDGYVSTCQEKDNKPY